MSQTPSPQSPPPAPPPQSPPSTAATGKTDNRLSWLKRHLTIVVFAVTAVVALLLLVPWVHERRTHSITDDGFVESHIVNVAPEMVSGRIVRFLVDENDSVEQGDIIAEIDAVPYQDRVKLAQTKVAAATAELKRQEAD